MMGEKEKSIIKGQINLAYVQDSEDTKVKILLKQFEIIYSLIVCSKLNVSVKFR